MNSFKVNNRRIYEVSSVSKVEQIVLKGGVAIFAMVINICLFELYF